MTDHCPTCGAAVRVEACGVTHYFVPIADERVRELEAALEQSKERLSAARVKYEQPMMAKALGLQKRVESLEAALRALIYGYQCQHKHDQHTEAAMKALENKP